MARELTTPNRGLAPWSGGRDPFFSFRREMNRLFDDVFGDVGMPAAQHWNGGYLAPNIDVSETDGAVHVKAELPGVSEKDVDVMLDGDILTIKGEKKSEKEEKKENYYFSERAFGSFQRSIRLPFPAEADKVKAKFENGVLYIAIPKGKEQARVKRIAVKGGNGNA